jgi:hypothetical protein
MVKGDDYLKGGPENAPRHYPGGRWHDVIVGRGGRLRHRFLWKKFIVVVDLRRGTATGPRGTRRGISSAGPRHAGVLLIVTLVYTLYLPRAVSSD